MSAESRADALEVLERVAYNGSMSFKNGDKLLCFIVGKFVTDDYWGFPIIVKKDIF